MADNTSQIAGLFMTPELYQQQQNDAALARGIQLAQLDPFQRATAQMYQGGYLAGGALGQALGAQDPMLQQLSTIQQLGSQFDLSSSAGNLQMAKALQDRNLAGPAAQFAAKAAALRKDEASAMPEKQRLAISMADTKAQRGTPEWKQAYEESLGEVINPDKLSTNEKDYRAAVNGGYKGSFNDWVMQKTREGAARVNVDNRQESAFNTELGKGQAKVIMDSKAAAEDAASILKTNQVGRQLLDSGAITGTGAPFLTSFNIAMKQAGIDFGYADAAANTQAFAATIGANVGKLIKQFGSGTGLSDADRKYAQQIAAGDISLDEKAIRKILDINDKASRAVIKQHNKTVQGIKSQVPLTVDMPEEQTQPPSPANNIPTKPTGKTGNPLVDKYLKG